MEKRSLDELAGMAPGPALGALLESLDLATVPNSAIVEVLRASWRQVSHSYAVHLAAMAEVGRSVPLDDIPPSGPDSDPADQAIRLMEAWEWSAAEISAALTFTRLRTDTEFGYARSLIARLPQVWAALRAGKIDIHKAKVFVDYLAELTDPQITRICDRLLPRAPGWTTGQLAARLLREVLAIDPAYTRRRYQRAVSERDVWGYLAPDGTAVLAGHGLSPSEAAAAAERLEDLARAVHHAGHLHTERQLRADLFVRLLDGRFTGFTREQIIAAMLGDCPPASPAAPGEPEPAEATAADAAASDADAVADIDTAADTAATDTDANTPASPDAAANTALNADAAANTATAAAPLAPGGPRTPAAEPAMAEPPGASSPSSAPTPDPTPLEGPRHGLEIRIGLATLLGLDDHPAELPGWGPVDAEDARQLVVRQHAAEWRYAVTDDRGYLRHDGITRFRPRLGNGAPRPPCRGGIVEIHVPAALLTELARCPDLPVVWAGVIADIARQYARRHRRRGDLDGRPGARHPHAGLRRHIQIRDRTCVAPGCRRPARKADQDHTRAHRRGGPTTTANLEPLCDLHHLMKHQGRWRLEQPDPGRFRWTSPLGQTYDTRGDHICPDLPDAIPRPPDPEDADTGGECTTEGPTRPIFNPGTTRRRRRAPDPPAPRPHPRRGGGPRSPRSDAPPHRPGPVGSST